MVNEDDDCHKSQEHNKTRRNTKSMNLGFNNANVELVGTNENWYTSF